MKLFSYQKNTDLHALSAGTTINNFLKFTAIKKCRRFIFWDINVPCEDDKTWIDEILSKTYYLLNTNKEAYYLSTIPGQKKDGCFHVLVQIKNSLFEDQAELIQKINHKCQTNILKLNKSLLWDLVVEKHSYKEAEDFVRNNLLDSATHPFLLNPIFQQSEILQAKTIIS